MRERPPFPPRLIDEPTDPRERALLSQARREPPDVSPEVWTRVRSEVLARRRRRPVLVVVAALLSSSAALGAIGAGVYTWRQRAATNPSATLALPSRRPRPWVIRPETTPGTGNGATDRPECPAFAGGRDFRPCVGRLLGGAGPDRAAAVDIAPDGTWVLAVSMAADPPGLTPQVMEPGPGALVRVSPDGRTLLSVTRVGAAVLDVDVESRSGRIAAAGSFGIAVWESDGTLAWRHELPGAVKVSAGHDGTIAALATEGDVSVFDATGEPLARWREQPGSPVGITMDGASGTVLIAGNNVLRDRGLCIHNMQQPWLRGYDLRGRRLWRAYDLTPEAVRARTNRCGQARARLLTLGRDGKAYLVGEAMGAEWVWNGDAQDAERPAPNVAFDEYNTPTNLQPGVPATYFARFAPASGQQEAGQFLITRLLHTGRSNTIRATAVAADERGQVFITGMSACCIADRDALTINGAPARGYTSADAFLFVASPDFRRRTLWTALGREADARPIGLAVGHGMAALIGTSSGAPGRAVFPMIEPAAAPPDGETNAALLLWRNP